MASRTLVSRPNEGSRQVEGDQYADYGEQLTRAPAIRQERKQEPSHPVREKIEKPPQKPPPELEQLLRIQLQCFERRCCRWLVLVPLAGTFDIRSALCVLADTKANFPTVASRGRPELYFVGFASCQLSARARPAYELSTRSYGRLALVHQVPQDCTFPFPARTRSNPEHDGVVKRLRSSARGYFLRALFV